MEAINIDACAVCVMQLIAYHVKTKRITKKYVNYLNMSHADRKQLVENTLYGVEKLRQYKEPTAHKKKTLTVVIIII